MTPLDLAVGDHLSPADGDALVYRVVGTGDPVAILRVTDSDGRRVHSGELERVDRGRVDRDFTPAADPDAGFSPVRLLRNQLSGLYWQFRKFL